MKFLKTLLFFISIVNFEFIQSSDYDRKTLELMSRVNSHLGSEYSINEQSATAIAKLCKFNEYLVREVPLNPGYQPEEDFTVIFRLSYGKHPDKKTDKRLRNAFGIQGCYILDSLIYYNFNLNDAIACRPDSFADLKDFESSGCVIQQKEDIDQDKFRRGTPYKFEQNPFYDKSKQETLQRTYNVRNKS